MARGYTGLDSNEYDQWLASNRKERELLQRKAEKRAAFRKDGSGWSFGIDKNPVPFKNMDEFRRELDKRGLAIEGEYRGKKK